MDLITTIHMESEEEFDQRLQVSCDESRRELIEIRHGLKNRAQYVTNQSQRLVHIDTNEEKVRFIKHCYPRAYRVFAENFPCAVERPNEMAYLTCQLVDRFINGMFLKEDRAMLAFS